MSLKRALSLTDATSLLFSSMVGSGIFLTTGFVLKNTANPYFVLIAWFLGGFFALIGAYTYSYSAKLFPFAGGDYVYLREAYSPLIAFMSGWTSLVANFSASISVLGITFSIYFLNVFSDFPKFELFRFSALGLTWTLGTKQFLGIVVITFFTVINYFGVKKAVRLQNVFTFSKVGGLLLLLFAGLLFGKTTPVNFQSFPMLPNSSNDWTNLFLGVIPVTFSYLGWNMVTYVAEEIIEPEKNIRKSVALACFFVTFLYLAINTLFLLSAPVSTLLEQKEMIGAVSVKFLFGEKASRLISIFVTWVVLGSLSAVVIGGSRIYFAMARDGLFFKSFANLHPQYHSPYVALFFQAIYASLFMMVEEIESLLYMVTCSIMILSILTAATPYIFHRRGMVPKVEIPFYPYSPFLFIAFNLFLVVFLFYTSTTNAIWGFAVTLSSIPVYYLFLNKKDLKKK